jgi:hypothetical protein
VQHAVDAEADVRVLALRLDVDVGRARVVRVLQQEVDGVDDVRVAGLDLRAGLQLDVLLEVAEVDGAAGEVLLGFGDRGAEAVLLVDDAHHVRLGGDDDVQLLLGHRPVRVDGHRVERIDHRHEQLPVADGHRHHAVLARERAGDLRFHQRDVELQRVDLVERQARFFGEEAREEEVVDARGVAARVDEVQRGDDLERARLLVRARLRLPALLETELAVGGFDVGALAVVDEASAEEQVAEVGDGDVARDARYRHVGEGHREVNLK